MRTPELGIDGAIVDAGAGGGVPAAAGGGSGAVVGAIAMDSVMKSVAGRAASSTSTPTSSSTLTTEFAVGLGICNWSHEKVVRPMMKTTSPSSRASTSKVSGVVIPRTVKSPSTWADTMSPSAKPSGNSSSPCTVNVPVG